MDKKIQIKKLINRYSYTGVHINRIYLLKILDQTRQEKYPETYSYKIIQHNTHESKVINIF